MVLKKSLWFLFIFLAIVIGLYPLIYLILDMTNNGLLANKNVELVHSSSYLFIFYLHISFGGLSLLIGWSQFIKKWRQKYLRIHRTLGKTYIISVLISAFAGLYIALYADGGLISTIGFSGLALSWLFTTVMAYISIKNKLIEKHQNWMIRSFSLTFAAVTLRILMPLLPNITGLSGIDSYRIVSYLCWIPNLVIAEYLIIKKTVQL